MVAETSIRPMRSAKTCEEEPVVIILSIFTDFYASGKPLGEQRIDFAQSNSVSVSFGPCGRAGA
jgi:hypothetical protein